MSTDKQNPDQLLQPTPAQVLGPYFLENSPFRGTIWAKENTGKRHTIYGRVVDQTGTPITGATIHYWCASVDGKYDNQDAEGNPIDLPPAQHRLRGRIITRQQKNGNSGSYRMQIDWPGNYPVGDGKVRPQHLHLKIEAPGFKTLITQLYTPADKEHNEHDLDGPGFFRKELLVPFRADVRHADHQIGEFQIVLEKA